MDRNNFLKIKFSCLWKLEQRTHIRNQAELVNRVHSGGSQGGETSWDQWYSQKYITQISSEQTTNLNIKKKKITGTLFKKLTGNVKENKKVINIQIID